MMPSFISKELLSNFLGESFAPVIVISIAFHMLLFVGIVFMTKALYKSHEFERPYTFELVRLSDIFEMQPQPSGETALQRKSSAKKIAPSPPQEIQSPPVQEKIPEPSTQKNASPTQPEISSAPTASAPALPSQSSAAAEAKGADHGVSSDNVYETAVVDEAPQLLKKTDPFYPELVRDQGISGTVIAQIIIDEKGDVMEIKILNSPHELLSDEVYKAVSRWKYKPGKFKGAAVKVKNRDIRIDFQLTE